MKAIVKIAINTFLFIIGFYSFIFVIGEPLDGTVGTIDFWTIKVLAVVTLVLDVRLAMIINPKLVEDDEE